MIRERNNLRRVVLSSLVGAVIEWYDFFLYGVVAGLVFNKLFFPEFSEGVVNSGVITRQPAAR